MLETAEFLATFCVALFAGAALYINLVEHPSRRQLPVAAALAQWVPSYHRATLLQAPLAGTSCLAAMVAWLLGASPAWLVASVLIGAVVPFTFIAIMPTNRQLQAEDRDPVPDETGHLLRRWGTLHAVRTVLSLAALLVMLRQLIAS